jgi:hypothetical protein
MSYDLDAAPFADAAAAVAARHGPFSIGISLDHGEFTIKRTAEFMNPWHDEIGRFAPKGTGSTSKIGETGKMTRQVDVPRSIDDAALVGASMGLYHAVESDAPMHVVHEALARVIAASQTADPDLVEDVKRASRALGDGDLQKAHLLLMRADKQVFTPFTEEFEVQPPEHVEVTKDPSGLYSTVTPEGVTIAFDDFNYPVSEEQVQTILSAATTAARAGNLGDVKFLNVQVKASWNRDSMSYDKNVLGFVVANADSPDSHRTVNLTPELINGDFDPGGRMPRTGEALTASEEFTAPLRWTVMHEMGHVGLFEEAFNRRPGEQGKEWFNEQMTQIADTTPLTDKPFMSTYAQQNTVEMHAEAFAEWTSTGGNTNNPWVNRMAEQFGWSKPAEAGVAQDLPLAASGAPVEPWIPIFPYPAGPVTLIDGPEHASYLYGEPQDPPPVQFASPSFEFANPWHDEIGRFAPKGTGTNFDAASATQDVVDGKPISVTGQEAVDLGLEMARLSHPVDLTLVTVDGSASMFSEMRENHRSRVEMPQIPTKYHGDFADHLGEMGISMTPETIDPRELKATQSELDGQAVGNMIRGAHEGGFNYTSKPMVVSSDNHILDGHHRWAAAAIESAACGGCIKMPILRVDLPMSELLGVADSFADGLGIKRQGHGEHGKHGPQKIAAAVIPPLQNEHVEFATDAEDGITDEQLADLTHGDGSAFANPIVASAAEFANPWHDEIGRFAPKGTGSKIGFDRDKADDVVDGAQRKLEGSVDYLNEAYKVHYERGEESESTFNQARDEYLAYGSSEMDRQLRKNGDAKVVDAAHRKALLDASVLDEAMDRGGYRTPGEEIVLLRGIRGENAKNIVAGTRFIDPGFVSVTASPGEAAQAAGKGGGVLVALRIPPHTKALAGSKLEQEIILPRGGEYVVKGITEGKDGLRIAEVEAKFPAKPPVTPGLPTVHDMVSEVSRQRQRKLQKERPLAASATGNIVHERLSWDLNDFNLDGAMTTHRHFGLLYIPETIEFANPWHDEIGRFAPKGSGSTGALSPGDPNPTAEKLLTGDRIALADVGVPTATPAQVKLTTDTRDDDALWATAKPITVSANDKFVASEESVKTGPVRKVVLGGEAFRPGYPPRLYQLDDGSYLVADGHHRIVMHKLLNTPSFDAIVLPYPKDNKP